jgi:transposase
LIPPIYVKPFVRRQENDATDAEAIVEAASRPTMRFVAVKTEDQQARAMIFRTRDLLVRQRTQLINALRGHLAEHGIVAAQGIAQVRRLAAALHEAVDTTLPALVRELGQQYLEHIDRLSTEIAGLEQRLRRLSKDDETAVRLQTVPGIGPVTAAAIEAFAPPMTTFRRGRDFAAWLGLVPRQHSTGGKPKLGRISKMGQRDIRRLLIIGAMAVVRWAARKGAAERSWLARQMAKKPHMVVAIALANKMARSVWAMLSKGEDYRGSALVAA